MLLAVEEGRRLLVHLSPFLLLHPLSVLLPISFYFPDFCGQTVKAAAAASGGAVAAAAVELPQQKSAAAGAP